MKRVLLDVNVILDVLLDRKPHAAASAAASAAVENRALEGLLSADAVMTIHYLIARERGAVTARRNISALLGVFGSRSRRRRCPETRAHTVHERF
jgi:predicted nucleic acid-binding protein